eukprot:2847774-Amphidinium_carterae.1
MRHATQECVSKGAFFTASCGTQHMSAAAASGPIFLFVLILRSRRGSKSRNSWKTLRSGWLVGALQRSSAQCSMDREVHPSGSPNVRGSC